DAANASSHVLLGPAGPGSYVSAPQLQRPKAWHAPVRISSVSGGTAREPAGVLGVVVLRAVLARALPLVGEERLELGPDLLGGRELDRLRQQGGPALVTGAGHEGVELLLERVDDRPDLGRLRDLALDLGGRLARGHLEV